MIKRIALGLLLMVPTAALAQDQEEKAEQSDAHPLTQDMSVLKYAPNVPVIKGFGETLDFSRVRTEPDGRYVEAWLKGSKSSNDALRIYKSSLPGYGWTIVSELDASGKGPVLVFTQKEQRLRITVYADTSGGSILRFQISPLGE
jgi:hypothetical protein